MREKLLEIINQNAKVKTTNIDTLRMIEYNDNSEVQAMAASILSGLITKYAAKTIEDLPENGAVRICEYGCATGGSSIEPIKAIEGVASKRKLEIIMNDLPKNDWSTLQALIEKKFPNINFLYSAKTMYSPVAEAASIHLGFSCFAQHWLNGGAPTGLPGDALWANQLSPRCPEHESWQEASRDNWQKKLELRATEIIPGGRLILHIHSSLNDGALSERFATTLQKAKAKMIANNELSKDQALDLLVPQYCKSPAEIFNIVCTPKINSLWQLEEAHYQQLLCDEQLEQTNIQKQIKFLKGFMDSTLKLSLSTSQLTQFWQHVVELASEDETALTSNGMSTFMSLKRRQ